MPIEISNNHPMFLLKSKMQEASQELVGNFGFSYFQYLRCYSDGSVGILLNDTRLTEHCWQDLDHLPAVYSSFNDEHQAHHSYWFLWDEALPEFPVSLARKKFNICNGLTLVRRNKDYYDMIAVALPEDINNAGSFYLNKQKAIEQFITKFDRDGRDLISLMDKNRIALSPHNRDENYKKMCLPSGRLEIEGKSGTTYVTAQELACLRLISSKLSQKEVARMLDISPRSVETYLTRVKARTGFSSREIERMLMLHA